MAAVPVEYARRYRRLRWIGLGALALAAGSIAISGYVFWFKLACRALG